MRQLLLFLHLVAIVTWIGGGMLLAPWGARARRGGQPHLIAFAAETTASLTDRALVPAMLMAVATGLALAFVEGLVSPVPRWLIAKTALVAVTVAAALALQRPTGQALVAALRASSRKANAQVPHLARRQRQWGMVIGLLALVIMALAIFKP